MDSAESQTVSLVGLAAALLIAALGFGAGVAYEREWIAARGCADIVASFPRASQAARGSSAGSPTPVLPAEAPPAAAAVQSSRLFPVKTGPAITLRAAVAGIPIEAQLPLPSAPAPPPATVIETPALAPPDPCASPDDAVRQQAGCALDTQGAGYSQP